ncbi:isoamylase 2, chloroplastic [Amaranthus tricolor]|uniref:isoamylase 2, chloroplastic n=1 Tax=Amaranthus tricolor TaxID=29722 RepID=UPI00258C1404|nr:isoamylase 2, chloroplastic [Amaranthus tricolor]XP_057524150.1 isoamylase 2, chloroplastic [Amaranthus tricolor]XP_057524157.1 isoamylase 2, chloroplastic [Amaranthus tricolor]XP_057524163.1 isoamylase 2, chloroplastic [Amaranthus tricolor]
MAMLLTPTPIGFLRTISCSAESSRKFASAHISYDQRNIRSEGKNRSGHELVFGGSYDCHKRHPVRFLGLRTRALSGIPVEHVKQGSSKYLFRTENGGQVKVAVGKRSSRHTVHIEVLPSELSDPEKPILSWGIYRSDSSFIPLELQTSSPDAQKAIYQIPLRRNPFGTYVVEMEFESHLAPFYLSFVLKRSNGTESENLEVKSHRHTKFSVPVGFASGYPAPLGLSFCTDGRINFAFFSRNTESVFLCLFDDNESEEPALEIELDPYVNRTGDIWHASFDSAGPFVSYGYRCKGVVFSERSNQVLLDPYAKLLRKKVPDLPDLGELRDVPAFDWNGDARPGLALEKLVLYRLNVMQFTGDKSSKLPADFTGNFAGITEKLQHFKSLGINGILLEPIFPCNEKKSPYFPLHYFSPQQVYGPANDFVSAIKSMKTMVKKMHAHGIEVYLEVVFTHTTEDGILQAIDPLSYFYADQNGELTARNALNCNYPIVQQMIVDSLQYWVTEFHIDGFCFINASYLLKGSYGESLSRPPLIETIAFDPVLSKTKMIADFWDPYDMNSKETVFPHWKRWAEINSKFSCDVRNFLKGEGLISSLATRLCGSGDIFSAGRGPSFSFNYITRNVGLPLVDLVSFSKNDLASELSWNCGEEGPTNNKLVLERRLKQIRNFLLILFVSLGVPVLNMGDECGQSSGGSLAYSDRKPLNWNALSSAFGVQITQFISFLTSLRERRGDLLQRKEFIEEENIGWYHSDLSPPKWDDPSVKFLAMELKAENIDVKNLSSSMRSNLYVAFNAGENSETVVLPSPPEGMTWVRLVDTGLAFPGFFSSDGIPIPEQMPELLAYELKSYSSVLFEAKIQLA